MLDEAASGDLHIVAMGKVNDCFKLLLRHQCERTTGEFQRVYIFAHRLQHILQVPCTHWRIIWATNFCDTTCARFAFALVHANKWKCSFTRCIHKVISLSPFNGYAQKMRLITRLTVLLLSLPNGPLSQRWSHVALRWYRML